MIVSDATAQEWLRKLDDIDQGLVDIQGNVNELAEQRDEARDYARAYRELAISLFIAFTYHVVCDRCNAEVKRVLDKLPADVQADLRQHDYSAGAVKL